MFCVKCGSLNRDDAGYCARCGAAMAGPAPPPVPPAAGRHRWVAILAGLLVVTVALTSVAVCAWVIGQSHYQDGLVVVEGKVVVGADGDPIRLVQNPEAADVSWDRLVRFLSEDRTDQIRYDEGRFVCADFAETLHNRAEAAGIKAGFVFIEFAGAAPAHACNAFQTTDRGRVYIDDTGTLDGGTNADKTVDLGRGEPYCPVSIFPTPGFSRDWDCMGRVSDFSVTW